MQILAKFKKILYVGFRATLNIPKREDELDIPDLFIWKNP